MKQLNRTEYEALFKALYGALCRYGLGIISDPDQTEDIVQQAFIKLWDKRSEMDMNRSLKSYLYTSVRNGCINYIRDQKKFRSHVLDIDIYSPDHPAFFDDGAEKLEVGELNKRIQDALDKLPEKSKKVFLMSRNDHLKYREIAEKLGVTEKTVEAHMSKALKILREELKDYLLWWLLLFFGLH